jgi:hypothetical protein
MKTKDNTQIVVYTAIGLCVIAIIILTSTGDKVLAFDERSQAIATIIGGITGPVFSLFTLMVVLSTYLSDSREKSFRQALDFTERLLKVYTNSYQQYMEVGRQSSVLGENGLEVGNIVPYLRPTQPLFAVVISHLQTSQFSPIQYQAVVSILQSELLPLVQEMDDEIDKLGRDRNLEYNQIAQKQLTAIQNLSPAPAPV